MEKTHATRISNKVFFKHKYLTNPAVTPEDAILDAAADLTSQLQEHHTRHLGRRQLHDLTNLHTIFAAAAATNAADAPLSPGTQPADCRVAAPQAEDAVGPQGNAVVESSLPRRHALTTTSPPRVVPLPRATPHQSRCLMAGTAAAIQQTPEHCQHCGASHASAWIILYIKIERRK